MNDATLNAADNVTVPEPLTLNAAIGFALLVIVPVPAAVIDKLVYVPPTAKIKLPVTFIVDTAGVAVDPVKSKLLNQLPVVNVGIDAPLFIERLGAVVIEPLAVDPHVNVPVTNIPAVNPPVPDQVKLVRSAILKTTAAAVVFARTILNVLNAIERVTVLDEENAPVCKLAPNVNVPAVSV